MPWTPLILTTVCVFGVISGNQLLESNNRYGSNRYTAFTTSPRSNSESTSDSRNNDLKNTIVEDSSKSRIYNFESKLLKDFFGLTNEDDITIGNNRNFDGLPVVDVKSNTKSDFFSPNVRDLGESTLSDNFAVDNAITKLAETVGGGAAVSDGRNNDFKSTIRAGLKDNIQPAVSYHGADFYEDLLADVKDAKDIKRAGTTASALGCDCKIKNDLLDLGQQHFPRYLLNAVCQTEQSSNELGQQKCWRGSYCKPVEYKVKVLTFRTIVDHGQKDAAMAWLPDDLRQLWKFKTVTVAAGCFCSF